MFDNIVGHEIYSNLITSVINTLASTSLYIFFCPSSTPTRLNLLIFELRLDLPIQSPYLFSAIHQNYTDGHVIFLTPDHRCNRSTKIFCRYWIRNKSYNCRLGWILHSLRYKMLRYNEILQSITTTSVDLWDRGSEDMLSMCSKPTLPTSFLIKMATEWLNWKRNGCGMLFPTLWQFFVFSSLKNP